jgi:hypothetical protein
MINPNICKRVTVEVIERLDQGFHLYSGKAKYQGNDFKVVLRGTKAIKPGKRRLYLKFSILNDEYYLSDQG